MAGCAIAVVTDNLTYLESYQAFERRPGFDATNTLIPRGLRRFHLQTDTSAKPVNDQINMFITANLPTNFAYILRRINLELSVDTASDWRPQVVLRLFNHIPGQPLGTAEIVQVNSSVFVPAGTAVLALREDTNLAIDAFTGPFWSVHGGSVTFRVQMANIAAAAGAAGFVTTHCEFLEYDLTQAQRYFINTPIPVLTR